MKVIVKNLLNGKYLATTGVWTEEEDLAQHFDNSSEAYLFCATHDVQHAELAFGVSQMQTCRPYCSAHSNPNYPLDD